MRCECGNLATEGDQCYWCANPECEMIEIDGPARGSRIGTCSIDGRPMFRSRFAGTIYHSSVDR